ncbi:MAG: DUF58 domain-containing protein [Wenzhouxiangella sp.]|nr:MAG: DUF58 domain-containing protein [Wenzhouxiangella sp.]
MIKPSPRLLLWLAVWLAVAVLLKLAGAPAILASLWYWVGAGLLLMAGLDLHEAFKTVPRVSLSRQMARNWPVDSPLTLTTELDLHGPRGFTLLVHELYPGNVHTENMPRRLQLAPGEQARIEWRARATARGAFSLPGCHLAWLSILGLWWRRRTEPCQDDFRVYPNFNLVVQYGMLAGDRRLEEMGIHLQPRRGSGSDFHQLRDYRQGDSLRQVDWHATSRLRKLIAKDYQEERDQRVVFLLDCSRRMRAMDGNLSHFDQCLNALLLLAHVALKQGDEIALQTLAAPGGRERNLPPGRGQRQFGALLETVFDLHAGPTYPDFLVSATRLMNQQTRRSLVVILTNLRDEDHDELDPALALLRKRHLVVLADLREQITGHDRLALPSRDARFEDALLVAGSALYRSQRRGATRHLRQLGVIHLDLAPADLPAALVSQYRSLKAGGSL